MSVRRRKPKTVVLPLGSGPELDQHIAEVLANKSKAALDIETTPVYGHSVLEEADVVAMGAAVMGVDPAEPKSERTMISGDLEKWRKAVLETIEERLQQAAELANNRRISSMHAVLNWISGCLACSTLLGIFDRATLNPIFEKVKQLRKRDGESTINVTDLKAAMEQLGFDALDQQRVMKNIKDFVQKRRDANTATPGFRNV